MTDTITLNLTPQQLDIVANALGQRPYIESAPVLDAIGKQVAAHNSEVTAAGTPSRTPPDGSEIAQSMN